MVSNNSKTRKVNVKGVEYEYKMLGAYPAMEVGAVLIQVFAAPIAAAFDGFSNEEKALAIGDMLHESTLFSEIAIHLKNSLGDFRVRDVLEQLLYEVYKGSMRVNDVSEEFAGNLSGFLILLESALKENFGEHFLEYLEAKGFKIPTLAEMTNRGKSESTIEESQSE